MKKANLSGMKSLSTTGDLGALVRKRQEQDERENLANQFRKMWLKEKEQRRMVEAETAEQYKRYLHNKRLQERCFQDYKRMQRDEEQQVRMEQLLDSIRYKEDRTADVLAWRDDNKRLAIANSLTCWESSLVRREAAAIEAGKRARLAAQLAVKEAQARRVTNARDSRRQRARNIAAVTAQMRDAVRSGRNFLS